MRVWFGGPRILGLRTGISLGREDLGWLSGNSQAKKPSSIDGTFLYVIKGDHERVKVGVSNNPNRRIADLQTGSPFALRLAYAAVTPGIGFDIEAIAKQALHSHRCIDGGDEWFNVPTEMAVAAINAAAFKLGQPLLPVTPDGQIMQIASQAETAPQSRKFGSEAGKVMLIVAFIIILLVMIMSPSHGAEQKTVTCSGTLIDIWTNLHGTWPLAVVYDETGKYACAFDRSSAGHDPMRPCAAGNKCRMTGTYRMLGVGEQRTYQIQTITDIRSISAGSP